jgi:TANK-binding kinase 1
MVRRESENYCWDDADKLGEGSYGQVFRGEHKRSGEIVAVKKFKIASKVSMNEFEMLQRVKHRNIVSLFAMEEEIGGNRGGPVLIMEFCTGGSMEKRLHDPMNTFGMPDEDFLTFLHDLKEGVKHLREISIMHRDIKPANILQHKEDDGEIVYKLADFDAARELADGETFESIKGTEP